MLEIGDLPLYNHLDGRRDNPQLRKDNGSLKRLLKRRDPLDCSASGGRQT
jgi:hypothetical protein